MLLPHFFLILQTYCPDDFVPSAVKFFERNYEYIATYVTLEIECHRPALIKKENKIPLARP